MRYASETTGPMTSVHQWKPVPAERFAALLHHYSTIMADEFGHDAIHHTSLILDPETTTTIWYVKKSVGNSVSSPLLMTLLGPTNKTICFEAIREFDEPMPAKDTIFIKTEARNQRKAARLDQVARVAAGLQHITVIAPRNEDLADIRRIFDKAGGDRIRMGCYVPTELLKMPVSKPGLLWLHNFDHLEPVTRNAIMNALAKHMEGSGALAFTGDEPTGYASPEGLPKERI